MRRRLLAYGLALVSLVLLGWIVRGHLGELERLADVPPLGVLLLVTLFLVGRGLGGLLIWIGLAALGHRVGLSVGIMLMLLASYTNLVLPRSGIAPGAVYLRARHGVPYVSYISFAVASLLIATSLVGLTGGVVSSWLGRTGTASIPIELPAGFGVIAALAAVGILAPAPLFALLPERLRDALAAAHDAWLRLARQPLVLMRIVGVQVVTIAVRALKVGVALTLAGADVSFAEALLVSVCADVGMLISITPAGLGFREGGVLFGATLVGVDPGVALVAAVVDRLATTATIVVAGQLVLWRGLRDYWRDGEPVNDALTPPA